MERPRTHDTCHGSVALVAVTGCTEDFVQDTGACFHHRLIVPLALWHFGMIQQSLLASGFFAYVLQPRWSLTLVVWRLGLELVSTIDKLFSQSYGFLWHVFAVVTLFRVHRICGCSLGGHLPSWSGA